MSVSPRESAVPFTSRKHTVVACPVCDARRFHYLFSIGNHRLVRCTECNLSLLNPQPSEAEMVPMAQAIAASRRDSSSGEYYLDVLSDYTGSARGKLLLVERPGAALAAAATRRGFEVTCVEPAALLRESDTFSASPMNADVSGGAASLARSKGTFDLCLVVEVLEGVRDPRMLLQTILGLVRPDAAFLVAAVELDATPTRLRAAGEFDAAIFFHFTRRTLESLVFASGCRALVAVAPEPRKTGSDLPGRTTAVLGRATAKRSRPLLSIIVPVFNEAATFKDAFSRLLAHPFTTVDVEYLVVESNSTDGTRDLLDEFATDPRVRIVLEDRPRGKGHAVRTGLRSAQGDFIAIQDADLEYDVDDYDALLEPLISHREAFVLGARHGGRSRKMRQFAGQPLTSGILNFGHWFFTTLLNLALGVQLKDPFTMYKIFRRDCIHDLQFEANRFDFDWELVIKLVRKGYIPIEIPVNYRSRSFHEGKKVRPIRDPLSWLAALAKFRFQRLHRPPSGTPTTSKRPSPRH